MRSVEVPEDTPAYEKEDASRIEVNIDNEFFTIYLIIVFLFLIKKLFITLRFI